MAIIITLVITASRNKEELVAKDYYSQELKYQDKIDAINNEAALVKSIDHEVKSDLIVLALPPNLLKNELSGEIVFYCPSDSKKDLKIKMEFDTAGKQFIPTKLLQKGVYGMKLSWDGNGKKYFKEHVITIK